MFGIRAGICLFASLLLGGCYAAAWDREKLDYWSQQELSGELFEALPALQDSDEIRVLVFGDSGKPSTFQTVASWMEKACGQDCDFALMLGDNFYLRGPSESAPEEFERHFKEPLTQGGEGLRDLPYWAVLGNHGYVSLFARPPSEPAVQLEYTNTQSPSDTPLWLMPAHQYSIPRLPPWLTMVGFDSFFASDPKSFKGSELEYEETRDRYISDLLDTAKAGQGWRVAFGHHPRLTIGDHAEGNYLRELPDMLKSALPLIYFSGHDHDQQLIEYGGLIQVVQGAASKTRAGQWGSERAEEYFEETLRPFYTEPGTPVSAQYCEKLGFAIATFSEFRFNLTFYWGEEEDEEAQPGPNWSWKRHPDGSIERQDKAPGDDFTNLCP